MTYLSGAAFNRIFHYYTAIFDIINLCYQYLYLSIHMIEAIILFIYITQNIIV